MEDLYFNIDNCPNLYWDYSFEDWIFPEKLVKFNLSTVNTSLSYYGYTSLAYDFYYSDNKLTGLYLNYTNK